MAYFFSPQMRTSPTPGMVWSRSLRRVPTVSFQAPFWAWALASALLGCGFTFFSGAVQAWLVDALKAAGFDGSLESVFAKGEIVEGVAMLTGATAGGYLAQFSNLGVPYAVRADVLVMSFVVALNQITELDHA